MSNYNKIRDSENSAPAPAIDQAQGMAMILDSLDALVYVADMQTRELLFLNEYGRRRWGNPGGRKCWELLQQGQTGPCEFCSDPQLVDTQGKPTGVHVWEFQNTRDGRWYQCRDQAIRWPDGRLVRLEIATDITDRKLMEEELVAARLRAEALAGTDALTGLNNRREFFQLGRRALKQAGRSGHAISVIMLDIDHFKQINDVFGHASGDRVLEVLAQVLQMQVRDGDILGRLGGEEFGVILPQADVPLALVLAERLRSAIENSTIRHPTTGREPELIRCTSSFGIASCEGARLDVEALLAKADQALLKAKRAGRNRIECAR